MKRAKSRCCPVRADPDELLPGEREPNCFYIPINERQQMSPPRRQTRPSTSLPPVFKPNKDTNNPYLGAKRSFLASNRRRAEIAQHVEDMQWRAQQKLLIWRYNRCVDKINTNIKIRDEETLRRTSRRRPTRGEVFVPASTGPRRTHRLPREIQDSTYPRSHILYFGA